MKLVTAADVWYTQQQKTLDEIAEKLGVVAYRPSYHGAERDKNTVLFYLKEDEEHNREVDRQPVRYSRSEAKDRGVNVNSECVYRDHFWSFENSDANGQLDMGWATTGKIEPEKSGLEDQAGRQHHVRLRQKDAVQLCPQYGRVLGAARS